MHFPLKKVWASREVPRVSYWLWHKGVVMLLPRLVISVIIIQTDNSLCARHYSRLFTCVNSFHPHRHPSEVQADIPHLTDKETDCLQRDEISCPWSHCEWQRVGLNPESPCPHPLYCPLGYTVWFSSPDGCGELDWSPTTLKETAP